MTILRACVACGYPFQPQHARDRHCDAHKPRGRASRSPTTRAQNAEYARERARILAGRPACHWCGRPDATTVDHVIPVSRGGRHLGNLVPACVTCNSARQDNPDWRPRTPS